MDSNKEEADRCQKLAHKAIQVGDFDKAKRLLEKANRMYPSDTINEMLNRLNSKNINSNQKNNSPKNNTHRSNISSSKPTRSAESINSNDSKGATSASEASESMCKRILKAKNFYETLGVAKDADEIAIKKAYKKLALQLHPDKCKAPSAEEAFKRIALAFQTLSDSEKRKDYDTFGENGPPSHSATGDVRYYQYHSDGFLTPEDLFRMFFGGVPAEVSFQRQRFTRDGTRSTTRMYTSHSNNNGINTNPLWQKIASIIQILPVLLMLFLAIIGNFLPSFFPEDKPLYSLNRTREYNRQKWTGINNIPFFVNPRSNFDNLFPPNSIKLQELEVQIEMIHFTRECGVEERIILQDIAYAKYYQSRSKLKEIQNRSKPNCEKLKWLRDTYPGIYKQAMRS